MSDNLQCKDCIRCEKRTHAYGTKKAEGYHCKAQPYDVDISPDNPACDMFLTVEDKNKMVSSITDMINKLRNEADEEKEELERKKLWEKHKNNPPVKLPIINDGYGRIPICPVCEEMPYDLKQCYWCGQRFIQDEEIMEYQKPLTKEINCISCGRKVIAKVSRYNGHIRYQCECGCKLIQ